MEGTIGEIRIFASNFAPRNWAFCEGQLLAIRSNTALFSILGTFYGGNGSVTFALPDFRGRAAVGAGQGPGLSPYQLGEQTGSETVTLLTTEMPAHTHVAIPQPGGGAGGTTATLFGINGAGGQSSPGGNYIGQDSDVGLTTYANNGNPVPMHAGSVGLHDVTAPLPAGVLIGPAGASIPHDNMQPTVVLNYIICMLGTFPSRN